MKAELRARSGRCGTSGPAGGMGAMAPKIILGGVATAAAYEQRQAAAKAHDLAFGARSWGST